MTLDPTTVDDSASALPARRRAVCALAAACAGIILAREAPVVPLWAWLAIGSVGVTLGVWARGRACAIGLAIVAFALGGAWLHTRVLMTDSSSLVTRVALREDQPSVLRITGVVRESPRVNARPSALDLWVSSSASPRAPATFSLRLLEVASPGNAAWTPVRGTLWVSLYPAGAAAPLHAGDTVELLGLYRAPGPPTLEGRRDARLFAAQEDVVGWLIVQDSPARVVPRPMLWTEQFAAGWLRVQAGLRSLAAGALDGAVKSEGSAHKADDEATRQARSLLSALLLGQYDPSIRPVADAWGRLGLLHALSISGFHIAVMAGMVLVLVRLPGDQGRLEPLIAALLVGLYLIIIPAQAPVLRSGIMIGIVLLAECLGRRYDRVSLLAWIALVLLAWRPMDAFDPGFQLSFALTSTMMTLAQPTAQWLFAPRGVLGRRPKPVGVMGSFVKWVRRSAASLVAASVLAWCISTPIVAFHFGVASPLAVIASVLVVPVIVPTLWLGYLVIALGVIVPPAAAWCGLALDALGQLLVTLTAWMDELPGAGVMLPAIPLWLAAAGTIVAVWVFVVRRRRDARVWTAVAAVGLATAVTLTRAWRGPSEPVVDVLPLDGGSCTLVRDGPHGVLVDVGTERASELVRLARDLPAAVRALGGWQVRTVVLSSARPSACSGLLDVIRPLGVSRVLVSPAKYRLWHSDRGTPFSQLLSRAAELGVSIEPVSDGDTLTLEHASLYFDPQSDGTLRIALVPHGAAGTTGAGKSWIPSSAEPAK